MKQIEVKAFVNHADGVSEKCRVCSGDVYGHAGDMEIPLCKEHFVKTMQLSCFYGDKEGCPFDGTTEEWDAVKEIINWRRS